MGDVRTIGVQEELHVVDLRTGRLSAKASQLLHGLPEVGFSAELQRTTVETNTGSNALWQLALIEMWLQTMGVR